MIETVKRIKYSEIEYNFNYIEVTKIPNDYPTIKIASEGVTSTVELSEKQLLQLAEDIIVLIKGK